MAGIIERDSKEHKAHLAGVEKDGAAVNPAANSKATPPATKEAALEQLMAKTKEELLSIADEACIETKPSMNKEEIAKLILESEPK